MKENKEVEQIISKLNSIADRWAEQFETRPQLELTFSASEDGVLALNGRALPVPASEVDPDSIYVDLEWVGFSSRSGETVDVHICWPCDGKGKPQAGSVRHTFSLWSA